MTYDFTLDKKAAVSLMAGSVLMALLLFAGGWIVGMYWSTRTTATDLKSATGLESERAALPKEPVLRAETDQPGIVAPPKTAGPAKPETLAPGQVAGAPKQPDATLDQPANTQTGESPPVGVSEKTKQEAAASPGVSSATDNASANSPIFTVQVGAFLKQDEASSLLKDLERKGYAPSFFADRDSENRQWYVVRIGAYADKDQAGNAAASFTKQEKIKAIVRPLGSL